MNSTIGSLSVRMGIDSAAFKKGVTELQRRARGLERSLQKTARSMQRIGRNMSIGLTAPLTAIGVSAVRTAGDYREALAQVEAGQKSMGDVSGRTMSDLKKQADELQATSLFTKQDILNGVTSNLLTFGNVAGEQFDRAQQAALDLSARLEQDLKSSTVMIGKALNDPVLGITAMSRAGIQFTEDQKDMIKGMVEMGDTAGAQTMILAELERQFAGSAKAAQDAAPGDEIMDPWNDFKILLGDLIYTVLPPLTEALGKALTWFNKLDAGVQKNIIIVAALVAALGPLIAALGMILGVFGPLIAAVVTLTGAGGMAGLGVALTALATGPLAIVLALLAGGAGLIWAYNKWGSATAKARIAHKDLYDLLAQSKTTRDQEIADTEAAVKAKYDEIRATRDLIKAKLEEKKVELEAALARRRMAGSIMVAGANGNAAAGASNAQVNALNLAISDTVSELAAAEQALFDLAGQELDMAIARREREASGPATFTPPQTTESDKDKAARIKAEAAAQKELNLEWEKKVDLYQQEYEADMASIARLEQLRRAHEATIQAMKDEAAANHEIASAYKVSRQEGELVARTLALMANNARLSKGAARSLAEELIASESAVQESMDALNKKAEKTGDTMADAFKRGADGFTGLINAIKSGDIGGILDGAMGFLKSLGIGGGAGGSGGGNVIKSIGSFLGFEGGGHTGSGPRSGGIDGKGGFMAMLHPNETVIDHTRPMRGLTPPKMPSLKGGEMPPIRIAVEEGALFRPVIKSESAKIAKPISQMTSQAAVGRASKSASKRASRSLA